MQEMHECLPDLEETHDNEGLVAIVAVWAVMLSEQEALSLLAACKRVDIRLQC